MFQPFAIKSTPLTLVVEYRISQRPIDSITNCTAIEQNNKLRATIQSDISINSNLKIAPFVKVQSENRKNEFDLATKDSQTLVQAMRADRIYAVKQGIRLNHRFKVGDLARCKFDATVSNKVQTNTTDISTYHGRGFASIGIVIPSQTWLKIDATCKAKFVRDLKGNNLVMNDLIFPFNAKGMQNLGNQKGFDSYVDFNVKFSQRNCPFFKDIGVRPFVFFNAILAGNARKEDLTLKDSHRVSSGIGLTWLTKYFTVEAYYSLFVKCKAGEQSSQFQVNLGFD